jgi:hypothetical protein
MDYGLVTFRSHPCDKNLDEQFYQMITPILNKSEKYIVAQEDSGTPSAHYHIVMSFKGDISHLRQKFASKPFKQWVISTISTMTIMKSPKYEEGALQLKKIKLSEEDLLHTIGYVCKENVIKTKGFEEKEITEACKYYHTCERKKPQKIDSTWRILNVKTVIPYMEEVAKKYEIPPYHKYVFYYMAKEKMYVDLSSKTKDSIRATLRVAYEKNHDLYQKDVYAAELNGNSEEGDDPYTLRERIRELTLILKANNIDY